MERSTPKLSDVARMAGVSEATASRALSDSKQVRDRTRLRVYQAAELLGYVASGAARALASRRSGTIGAVVPTLNNAIFATSINALQQALAEASYNLLVASHEYDPQAELDLVRRLVERGVDALMLVGTDHAPALFALLDKFRIPYVLTWAIDAQRRHPCIGFDNRAAAAEVTRHLLDQGHRRFAMICGITAHNDRVRERIAGVRDALRARGLELRESDLIETPYSFAAGKAAMREFMLRPQRPTAVICTNDVHAIGAHFACQELGIDLPREVSITGFDDMEISSLLSPGLSTMRVPKAELGRAAAIYLLGQLRDDDTALPPEMRVQWVERGSTAPPPVGKTRKPRA